VDVQVVDDAASAPSIAEYWGLGSGWVS
jgi:hypothetical protein